MEERIQARIRETNADITFQEENRIFMEVNPVSEKGEMYGLGNIGRALAATALDSNSDGYTSEGTSSRVADEVAKLREENEQLREEQAKLVETQATQQLQQEKMIAWMKMLAEKSGMDFDPFDLGGTSGSGGASRSS